MGKKHTEGSCSRREFIKLAAGAVAAIGFLSGPQSLLGELVPGEIICGRCGGKFAVGNVHEEGPVSGVFCPACGVELTQLEYVGVNASPLGCEPETKKKILWDWAQVPFPNRKLVQDTSKAKTIFKDIRI